MPGKPNGKNQATKKSGPARKAAEKKSAEADKIKDALTKDLRDIIKESNKK